MGADFVSPLDGDGHFFEIRRHVGGLPFDHEVHGLLNAANRGREVRRDFRVVDDVLGELGKGHSSTGFHLFLSQIGGQKQSFALLVGRYGLGKYAQYEQNRTYQQDYG